MAENNETVMNNENAVSSDLEALLKEQLNNDTPNVPEATNVVEESNNEIKEPEVVNTEELSPLEQMKLAKKNSANNGKGIVMTNEELQKNSIDGPKRDFVHNDERMSDIQQSINDLDESIKKRQAVTLIKHPEDQAQFTQAMIEIDMVKFDSLGKAYIDIRDDEGNPVQPQFIRIRQDDEPIFDFDSMGVNPNVNKEMSENSEEAPELDEKQLAKAKTVQILIDKTGFGANIEFTEAEKAKIKEAETLLVNEVKVVDINAIKSKRSEKSFQDVVHQFDTSGARTTICFPGSGFKAQMKAMSYGEYADIALSMDNVTFDQYYKRLSVIYNKMTNISTGPFKTFEEFLKNLAYTDIQMALYGLYVSTEESSQEIQLRCGNDKCNKLFNYGFDTRSVIKLEDCADVFLEKMKEIATAPAADYDKIKENAAVHNSKFIEMPQSKYIVEMGLASAYDFLYNFIPLMDEETFKNAFGDDLNEIYMNNILLLTSVRSVRVPDEDGSYIECYGYKDILDAIYNLSPVEAKILAAYTAEIQKQYEISFSLGKVVCPHCGNITPNMEINMDELVFQTYQRLMSTEVDLKNILDF